MHNAYIYIYMYMYKNTHEAYMPAIDIPMQKYDYNIYIYICTLLSPGVPGLLDLSAQAAVF